MGVMKKAHVVARVSPSAIDDEWQRRASAAAIRAARGLVRAGSYIPSGTPVGRLSDTEWGWGLWRDVIRVDSNARRTGGRRAARCRANNPHDRARPATVGHRRGHGDPAGTRRCLP